MRRACTLLVRASSHRPWLAAAGSFFPVIAMAMPARAQAEPIRIVYRADADCPSEASFVERVGASTGRSRRALDSEPARTFLVVVSREANASHGFLQVAGVDGRVTRRDVSGQTCDEVVATLAFITALAIDPMAGTSTPTPTAVADASTQLTAASDDPSSLSTPPDSSPHVVHAWDVGLGLDGRALAGFVPATAVGGGAFVEIAGDWAGRLVPSLRVSVSAAATQASFVDGVGARLVWWTARAEGCPARLGLGPLVTTACLKLDAGVLRSEGTGLPNSEKTSRPWVVPGVLARLTWPSSGNVWVEGSAGVGVPLGDYTFSYQQSGAAKVEVSRVSELGAEFGLGAGYRFR
jgi:hypothetical protein